MAATQDIGTLITRSRTFEAEEHVSPGPGVTVMRIARWAQLGETPEEIAAQIAHLSLAQVYAALTYYHLNREEIEADIAHENAATLAAYRQLHPSDTERSSQ